MSTNKWYLQTWLIIILFSLWPLIIPAVVGAVLLFLQGKENKKIKAEWEKNGFGDVLQLKQQSEKLKNEMKKLENDTLSKLKKQENATVKETAALKAQTEKECERLRKQSEKELQQLNSRKNALIHDVELVEKELKEKKDDLIILDEKLLYQSFGFYDPKYEFQSSEEYKVKLDEIRNKQKQMVKDRVATNHSDEWTLEGSKQKGRVLNNNNIKMTLRSFNNECDVAISKVTFSNIASMEKRIKKAAEALNKLTKHSLIEIRPEYVALKLDELYLAYEYQQKKEEEKEAERERRERLREEERVKKELLAERAKIEKEEKHFLKEIQSLQTRLDKTADEEKEDLLQKLKELEEKLELVQKDKENVAQREQNTRAGYVYIISNIGSFGENVFKIGMTRRLDPHTRIRELSAASVPFVFDLHALIFTEDAYALEHALHKSFEKKRVNKVNPRKEFFSVTLDEIKEVVHHNFDKTVEYIDEAVAQEYRESLAMQIQEDAMAS